MATDLNIHNVSLRNFQSYGANTNTIRLDIPGTTVICGQNLDADSDGNVSNGTGKTTIFNAVVYALYGKSIDNDVKLDELVNNINKKNMEVTCTFTVDSNMYTVRRTRKTKAGASGNTVSLFKHISGEMKDITPDSVDACNKEIVKLIGVPYDIFTRIVVFSATHIPFLSLPTRSPTAINQSDIIENLCGLTILTDKANLLKKRIADTELVLATKKTIVETQEKERKRFDATISSTKNKLDDWDKQQIKKINNLNAKLEQALSVDIAEQQLFHKQLDESISLSEDMSSAISTLKKSITGNQKKIQKLEHEITHLKGEQCPYCMQQYKADEAKIVECGSELQDLISKTEEWTDQLNQLQVELVDLKKTEQNIREKIEVNNIEELLEIKSKSESIRLEIRSLQEAVNPYSEVLEELLEALPTDIDYSDVNKLTKLIEHQKFLLKLLTKNDSFLRKKLLNKTIPYLNDRLQHALTALGMQHKVEFTHEMTAKVSQFGRELGFGSLSAGQKARVNLALSWAFRDVYQRRYRKINISLLDEALDVGLDSSGVQAAVKMLKRKARDENIAMFIISHKGDDISQSFDRRILIQLDQGFSNIIDDDALEN